MLASLTLNLSQFYIEFCQAYFQSNMVCFASVDTGKIWNVNCVLVFFQSNLPLRPPEVLPFLES